MSWENTCYECNRCFDHVNNLNTHLKSRRHHRGYRCPRCERMFHSENGLARHNEVVHHHPCHTCKLEFETEEQLNDHDNTFHRVPCARCEKIFRTDEARDQHRKAVHKIICCSCKTTFDDERALTSHNLAFHTFRCEECPTRVFKTSGALEAHWRSPVHHLQCMKCRQKFKDERSCFQHFSSSHPHACPNCPRTFTKQANLDRHLEAGHNIPCQWCPEVFETVQSLEQHQASAHVFQCVVCQQVFEDLDKLQMHLKSCPTVSDEAKSANPIILSALPESSTDGRKFECPTCEEICESSAAAIEHILTIHMYGCQDCKAHFEQQIDLFTHICYAKSHIQEPSHMDRKMHLMCQKCGESFANANQFSSHTINSHLLRCAKCPGQLFLSMKSLAEHSRVAHSQHVVFANEPVNGDTEVGRSLEFSPSSDRDSQFYSAQSSLKNMSLPNLESTKVDQMPGCHFEINYSSKSFFHCDQCDEAFQNAVELERHFNFSPFHGTIELKCHECNTTFFDQIQLLSHINSKPHRTKWVLSLV